MKKLLLHIVLFSYAIVIVKPALPYVSDFIAHVLFYKQHMATVHFENGKYHVHKEIVKDIKEENSNKNSLPEKKKNTTEEYTISSGNVITRFSSLIAINYRTYLQENIDTPYLPYNYPPPRV